LFVGEYANHCDYAFVGSRVFDNDDLLSGYDFYAADYVDVNCVEHNQHDRFTYAGCDRSVEHLLGCMGGGAGLR
jgi:hypothetical protein